MTEVQNLLDLGEQLHDPASFVGQLEERVVRLPCRDDGQKSLLTEFVDLLPGVGVPCDVGVDLGLLAEGVLPDVQQYVEPLNPGPLFLLQVSVGFTFSHVRADVPVRPTFKPLEQFVFGAFSSS